MNREEWEAQNCHMYIYGDEDCGCASCVAEHKRMKEDHDG